MKVESSEITTANGPGRNNCYFYTDHLVNLTFLMYLNGNRNNFPKNINPLISLMEKNWIAKPDYTIMERGIMTQGLVTG